MSARRRPRFIIAGVLLVVLAALASAWWATTMNHNRQVLVVTSLVQAGQVLQREDVGLTEVPVSSQLETLGADSLETLVGQRASTDLPAGTLLNASAVAEKVVPGPGEMLVGVLLTPAQMPAESVRRGDRVLLVDLPSPQEDLTGETPASIDGKVSAVGSPDVNGAVVVNVLVREQEATTLAAHAAIGRVSLVIASRER